MGLEGGMRCIKYFCVVFNFIFVCVGLALVIIGALVATRFKDYIDVLGPEYTGTPIVICVTGCVICIISFFGCCGSIKENHCMVTTFAFLLVVILIVQIGAGIAAYVLRAKVTLAVKNGMKDSLKEYNHGPSIYTQFVDSTQRGLKCCGGNNYTDYYDVNNQTRVAESCCIKPNCTTTYFPPIKPTVFYTEGCVDKLITEMKFNIGIVAGALVGFCIIQIIGIILACCLSRSLQGYEYV